MRTTPTDAGWIDKVIPADEYAQIHAFKYDWTGECSDFSTVRVSGAKYNTPYCLNNEREDVCVFGMGMKGLLQTTHDAVPGALPKIVCDTPWLQAVPITTPLYECCARATGKGVTTWAACQKISPAVEQTKILKYNEKDTAILPTEATCIQLLN